MRFGVPTAVNVKIAVFWDVTPRSLVYIYRVFTLKIEVPPKLQ
jgi:hypothetical protein